MKKNKISLALLGAGIIVSGISINTIDAKAAWGGSVNDNQYVQMDYNGGNRPLTGKLKANSVRVKNPGYLNSYFTEKNGGGDSGYINIGSSDVKLRSASLTAYGFKFLYYEPVKGSVPMREVYENKYAFLHGYREPLNGGTNSGHTCHNYYRLPNFLNQKSDGYTPTGDFVGSGSSRRRWNDYNRNYLSRTGRVDGGAWSIMTNTSPTYRFIGYNQLGEVLANPFFITDYEDRSGRHANGAVLGANTGNGYDRAEWKVDKEASLRRTIDYFSGTIRDWGTGTGETINSLMSKLSLKTNPLQENPMFYYSTGNKYSTIAGPLAPSLESELVIESMIVKDSKGSIVGRFTRSGDSTDGTYDNYGTAIVPGNKYTVDYVIKNTGDNKTKIIPAQLDAGFAKNDNALNGSDYKSDFNLNTATSTITSTEKVAINPGGKANFSTTFTAPNEKITAYRLTGNINAKHLREDDVNTTNNWGRVVFTKIAYGDFEALEPYLVDSNGNKVTNMRPGEKYKVKYQFKYNGADRDSKYDLSFTGLIKRYLPKGATETLTKNFRVEDATLTKGKVFTFTTEEFVFEVPKVDLTSKVDIVDGTVNSDKTNDVKEKAYDDNYDIVLSNVKLYPTAEYPIKDNVLHYTVKYDIDVNTKPESGTTPYFEWDLNTKITLKDGTELSFIDHVKKGSNKDITHQINIPVKAIETANSSAKIMQSVNVHTNYDKDKWEVDLSTQTNNKGNASTAIFGAHNPNDFDSSTSSKGCPIDSVDNNKWSLSHEIVSYAGTKVSYNRFNNSKSYSFYDYGKTESHTYKETFNYSESYKIDSVKFKSKFTTDNKYGANGWVDLMKVNERDKAKIKAGYGYELQIDVTYKNDVFAQQSSDLRKIVNSTSLTGLRVSNKQSPANINNDIYVRLSDGTTLSATGIYGTTKAFDATIIKSNDSTTTIRYTMRNNSKNEPMKIYTSENAKDGEYSINVFTPVQMGVGTPASKKKLCDTQALKFTVQGSMYDDNNDHIVQ